jgi:hypothetical protein
LPISCERLMQLRSLLIVEPIGELLHIPFMKSPFYTKTLVALTVAIVAAAGSISRSQDQPAPPAAGDSALPPDIDPNTPLAQVVKLAQSGVDISVIKNYIATSPGPSTWMRTRFSR